MSEIGRDGRENPALVLREIGDRRWQKQDLMEEAAVVCSAGRNELAVPHLEWRLAPQKLKIFWSMKDTGRAEAPWESRRDWQAMRPCLVL